MPEKIRFKYEITGPSSESCDPLDFLDADSIESLRLALMEEMADRVSWRIIPDNSDLEEFWAKLQKLKEAD